MGQTYLGYSDGSEELRLAAKGLRWLNRNSLNDLLTRELQEVAGCETLESTSHRFESACRH